MNVETSGSLDLSGELPPVMLEEPVRGSRTWGASDLTSEDWTIQLSEDALGEIHAIGETIRNHPLPDFLRGPPEEIRKGMIADRFPNGMNFSQSVFAELDCPIL